MVGRSSSAGIRLRVLDPTSGNDPLHPIRGAHRQPSRSSAAQRRAMQAALANAVRAMRSTGGRRGAIPRPRRTPPPGI
jgi:hypothetical protein